MYKEHVSKDLHDSLMRKGRMKKLVQRMTQENVRVSDKRKQGNKIAKFNTKIVSNFQQ